MNFALLLKAQSLYTSYCRNARKDGETSSKPGIASLNSVFMKDVVYKELT